MTAEMKTINIHITPALARKFIEDAKASTQVKQRDLRRWWVESIKEALMRGEYLQTHQGIAFTSDRGIADGQHRLHAIAGCPEWMVFPMSVTDDLPPEAYVNIDRGYARTYADALQNGDRRVTEIARTIAVVVTRRVHVTPHMLKPIISMIKPFHDKLLEFCPSARKTWSASPVRLAAVMSMMIQPFDHDYILLVYRAMVLTDMDDMPPVAKALYRSEQNGGARMGDAADALSRCMILFDRRKEKNTRVQIQDAERGDAAALVRKLFSHLIAAHVTEEPIEEKPVRKTAALKGKRKRMGSMAAGGMARA